MYYQQQKLQYLRDKDLINLNKKLLKARCTESTDLIGPNPSLPPPLSQGHSTQ